MPYFVVIEEQGSQWDDKRSMRDQKGWTEHAVFMDALAEEHFVILGGPLHYSKHRAMLILNAPTQRGGSPKETSRRPLDAHRSTSHARNLSLGTSPRQANLRSENRECVLCIRQPRQIRSRPESRSGHNIPRSQSWTEENRASSKPN
jgi:hypothetical protein